MRDKLHNDHFMIAKENMICYFNIVLYLSKTSIL